MALFGKRPPLPALQQIHLLRLGLQYTRGIQASERMTWRLQIGEALLERRRSPLVASLRRPLLLLQDREWPVAVRKRDLQRTARCLGKATSRL